MESLSFFLRLLFIKKLLTFGIFNELNTWAKVYHIWEIEVYRSTSVEITGLNSKHTKTAVSLTIQYLKATLKGNVC